MSADRNSYMEKWNTETALANLAVEKEFLPSEDARPDDTNYRLGMHILERGFPVAAESLVWLASASEDEKVRYRAAKMIVDSIVHIKEEQRSGNDPLAKLFMQAEKLANSEVAKWEGNS